MTASDAFRVLIESLKFKMDSLKAYRWMQSYVMLLDVYIMNELMLLCVHYLTQT